MRTLVGSVRAHRPLSARIGCGAAPRSAVGLAVLALLTATVTTGVIPLESTAAQAAPSGGRWSVGAAEPIAAAGPDTQAPSAPGRPQVLAVTPTTATISWSPATDNVGVTSYVVFQGDQFYTQWVSRTVPTNAPLTLPLSPTGASLHFSVVARDAAGNTSTQSSRAYVTQPPSFPRTGTETVPPTAPGAPVAVGWTPDGRVVLNWTPASDDVGVVEYHVYHTFNIDEVRVEAKVSTTSAVITPRGGSYERIRVVAYDAAWNSNSSTSVQLTLPPRPTPAPQTAAGR